VVYIVYWLQVRHRSETYNHYGSVLNRDVVTEVFDSSDNPRTVTDNRGDGVD